MPGSAPHRGWCGEQHLHKKAAEEKRLAIERRVQASKQRKQHKKAQEELEALGLQRSFEYTSGSQYFGNAIEAPPRRKTHPPEHPSAKAARSFGIPQYCIEKMGVPIPHGHGKLYRGPPTKSLMYDGKWHLGAMDGKGKYYWPDGSSWEGGFKKNKKHGRGIFRPATVRVSVNKPHTAHQSTLALGATPS